MLLRIARSLKLKMTFVLKNRVPSLWRSIWLEEQCFINTISSVDCRNDLSCKIGHYSFILKQGLRGLEKYLNKQNCLEKSMKINLL